MSEHMIKHKLFFIWNWDAEEIWLNRMAGQGWNLIKPGVFRYEFEKGEPGEWQYRLQALKYNVSAAESQEYLAFIESMGIEVVGTFLYWVYFRQKADQGPFEIFSDTASKIKHMKRIMAVIYTLLPLLILNILNVSNLLMRAENFSDADFTFIVCGFSLVLLLIITGAAVHGLWQMNRKLKKLKSQNPFS